MQLLLKIVLPLLIFIGAVFAAKTIRENAPEPRRRPSFEQVQAVEAITLEPATYELNIQSRGTVRPARENALVPEIAGTITNLSPQFVVGGRFAAGEQLIQIDQRDFEIALTQAQANVAAASATLQEERARSAQAKEDWKLLGRTGSPSPLSARLPQVAAARAALDSAQAQVKRAELDLARTTITAPFDGIVLQAGVAQGEFVARGAVLGRIYAASELEIRLPLTTRELARLEFPAAASETKTANVTLSTDTGDISSEKWYARLKRSEGIDARTQQAHVVATIADLKNEKGNVLQAGQYVNATILAQKLENVYVVPRGVIREGSQIVLVDGDDEKKTLQSVEVNISWTDANYAAIAIDGLPEKPILVTTVLGAVADGTVVSATIDGVAPPRPAGRSGAPSGRGKPAEGGSGRPGNSDAAEGKPAEQAQASGENAGSNSDANGQRKSVAVEGEWRERFQKWRTVADAGGQLEEADKVLIRARIEAGKPVPPWLQPMVK